MNILVIGEEANFKECQNKFKNSHRYDLANTYQEAKKKVSKKNVIFDFTIERNRNTMEFYGDLSMINVFFDSTKISLKQLANEQKIKSPVFGFAGLPTFLDREIFEVSMLNKDQESTLKALCNELRTGFQIVEDRVGLVTPRIICMIINEAYYTVQERTATKDDIDLAMKLGTNYPFGPFEWCQKIGVKNVYELLSAIYDDTKDERYKICPLLKKEYLLTLQ